MLSSPVNFFAKKVRLETYERQSLDFVLTMVKASDIEISATVQPTNAEQIEAIGLDKSIKHITAHTATPVWVGQFILDGLLRYKIVSVTHWGDFGYHEAVCAEVKGNIT